MKKTRIFSLFRTRDKNGISGTGTVAEGTEYFNSKVTLCWHSKYKTVEVFDSYNDFLYLHVYNHKNGSIVTFQDGEKQEYE